MDDLKKRLKELKKQYLNKDAEIEISFPDSPVEVNDEDFVNFINKYPVVAVDCWAPWCNPCKALAPIIKSLSKELKGKVVFGKLNVDKNKLTPNSFDVMNIPTLLIFKNGKLVDRLVGVYTKEQLLNKLSKFIGGE